MTWLSPWLGVAALAATVPPLVLLYFLKLRRREVAVASTLLWRQAVQDLQVNAPFQRLRSNLLLILQLIALALGAMAMMEPMAAWREESDKAVVLLVDQSGSMATMEGDRSRLDIAREATGRRIDNLGDSQQAMLIAFGSRARVLVPFTADKARLKRGLTEIRQTDEPGRLAEAMRLAEAHSTPLGEDIGDGIALAETEYVLFTDGRLPDSTEVVAKRGPLEVMRVGAEVDNSGIVALDVRRNYEQPELLSVLARVRNFGTTPVTRDLSLVVDGEIRSVRTIENLAPLAARDQIEGASVGGISPEGNQVTASFELTVPEAAELELRLSGKDAFAADDRGFAVVTPPRPLRVLLVSAGNRFLRLVLEGMPVSGFDVWSPDEYENKPEDELVLDGRCVYDVVVFDAHSTARVPPGNYLFFAGIPLNEDVEMGPALRGQVWLDWDETHPVLRHVAIEPVAVFAGHPLTLPPEADTLIEGASGPVLALLRSGRNQYLIMGFSIFDETREYLNTNWVLEQGESFVVFMYNALRYLAGSTTEGQHPPVRPGEAFSVAAKPGTKEVTVARPDARRDRVPVSTTGLATYGQTDRVGIYRADTGIAGEDARAVSLLDDQESFIAPNKDFRIAAGEMTEAGNIAEANRPLWPYVLGLMGIILLVEWFIYNKRVFI